MIPPQRRREGPDSRSLAQGGKDRWLQSCRKDFVLGRGLEGFLQIRTSLVGRLTLTNDVNVETTPDVPGILVSDRDREVGGFGVRDGSWTAPTGIEIIEVTDQVGATGLEPMTCWL